MFDLEYWKELDAKNPGWMSEQEARFLVENVQGEVYLEIGVAYGKSIQVVRHHYQDLAIWGIDKINHGVDKKVEVGILYGDANEIVSDFSDNFISTLFIDGDHRYLGCLSDFVHWYNKVKPGGRIIFHDYGRPTTEHKGVTQTVDAVKDLLVDHKQTNYIWCGTKPST